MKGSDLFGHERVHSPLLDLPEDTLFAWCHSHPEQAPAFVAQTILFLASDNSESGPVSVHPVMIRLLENFGDRENVISATMDNMRSGGWCGSQAAFYERRREPIKHLLEHPNNNVRRWAKVALREVQARVDHARINDAEREARFWS